MNSHSIESNKQSRLWPNIGAPQGVILLLLAITSVLVVGINDPQNPIKALFLIVYGISIPYVPLVYAALKTKLPRNLNGPVVIVSAGVLFCMSYLGILHRTYVGYFIVFLMLFTRDTLVLLFLLLVLFLTNNKISLVTGFVFVVTHFWFASNVRTSVKLGLILLFTLVASYVLYLKIGHWFKNVDSGGIEEIHAIWHRVENYMRVGELARDDPLVLVAPFDYRLINSEAMDSGYLVALFRWGAILMFFVLLLLYRNILRTFRARVAILFFMPLLTQAAYLNYIVLLPMLAYLALLRSPFEKRRRCDS